MRVVPCPTCRTETPWRGNPHRPFCSERCRLVDLEGWASGRFRIPGEPQPQTDDADEDGGSR